MSKNIKIILQYDGTRYDGWQKQGNTDMTIQGKLEAVLERLAGEPVEVHGAGRTDAGVHALGQTANFHLPEQAFGEGFDVCALKSYLNRYLPEDIAVMQAEEAAPRFHSRLNAGMKTYAYYIETGDKKPVFERKYRYGLGERLDIRAMEKAAGILTGTHDFRGFSSLKRVKKSTVRTISSIDIRQEGTTLILTFTGDGFLYNMVRILTGTLIEAGQGKKALKEIEAALSSGDRSLAGFTAPPEGLFLEKVSY